MRHLLRRRGDASGQGLVEFALAAPVIFLVLVGLIDGGRIVFINNEMSEAAREGARWGAVQGRAAAEWSGSNSAVTDTVRSRLVVTPAPSVSISCADPRGSVDDCDSGELLTVEVTSSVRAITPLISDILGAFELRSESQMTIH